MASPLPKTGIQLRVTAIAKKGTGKTTDVEVLIDTLGKDLTFTEKNGTFNNRLSISVGVFNKQGKSVFAERPDVDLNLRPETHARVSQYGVRILRHLSLPPGRYQLRVAAQDTGKAKQGSAHFDIDVPDFTKEPLALSNVALAVNGRSRGALAAEAGIRSLQRIAAGRAVGASRISRVKRDCRRRGGVRQQADAGRIGSTSLQRVKADDGRVVFNQDEERSSEELHGTPGGFGFAVPHPMTDGRPGSMCSRSKRSRDSATSRRVLARHPVRGEIDEISIACASVFARACPMAMRLAQTP